MKPSACKNKHLFIRYRLFGGNCREQVTLTTHWFKSNEEFVKDHKVDILIFWNAIKDWIVQWELNFIHDRNRQNQGV